MSKLTDITLDAYLNFGPNMSRDDNEVLDTMNKQLKTLMLEIIDDSFVHSDNLGEFLFKLNLKVEEL